MAPPEEHFFQRLQVLLECYCMRLPASVREAHVRHVLAFQGPGGGFRGRAGGEDLYYTGFGLPLLAALGRPGGAPVAGFLQSCRIESVIDLWQWLRAADALGGALEIPVEAEALLAAHRTPDGGFGVAPGAEEGSLYWTFLAVLCLGRLGLPAPRDLGGFLEGRRTREGGFREGPREAPATTNASAAGLFLAASLGSGEADPAGDFLARMQGRDGGFRAGPSAPLPDLLSSFTALAALERAGLGERIDRLALARFIDSLALPGGGFAALAGDLDCDVEYTFYGLAGQAVLAWKGGSP